VFGTLVGDGNEVVCVTITSKHSGTFNTAWAAAQRFGEAVSVVDSWSTSLGLGFLAMAAARSARKGASLSEVLALLRRMRARTHLLAVLDTIEYIRVGGRANALIPILSRLVRFLQIKPIIGFVEGELKLLGQARTFPAALAKVEQQMSELQPFEYLGVLHTRRLHDAQVVADRLGQSIGFQGQILVRGTGAVLSSHAGPGVIGVIGGREVRVNCQTLPRSMETTPCASASWRATASGDRSLWLLGHFLDPAKYNIESKGLNELAFSS
jgi:DegV family protein with EDD domain